MGFYRAFYLNLAFAGTSFALAAISLPGDSAFCGREPILGLAVVNFVWGFIVVCVIPSDFHEVLAVFHGKSRRIAVVGLFALIVYVLTGEAIGRYVSSLTVARP